eukprot:659926-Ditylum_brightwellii.AAC.1
MNMRYFWILDQIQQGNFNVIWRPGQENLVDYPTKHHPAAHHQCIRPYYIHTTDSPRFLPRALAPHLLRGCAQNPRKDLTPYDGRMTLPRVKTRNVIPKNLCVTQVQKAT